MSQPIVDRQSLRVIVGPTAAGKSAIAMALAEQYQLAIISADSRQLYRGFDIGTAKPSPDERARVPHFGIDVLDPSTRYSAHQWSVDAMRWIADSRAAGREVVVVGGTGFYLRALAEPLDAVPVLDVRQRERLGGVLDAMDADALERWCRRLDPARATFGRTQRLRAIETALLTGVPLSQWYARSKTEHASFARIDYLVVDPGPALASRIAARVQAMIDGGWADEVRTLLKTVAPDAPAWQASGYGAMVDYVQGTRTLSDAIQRVTIETRQYAKRQRTWNRHQLPAASVTMLDSTKPDAAQTAQAWWESRDRSAP